MTAARYQIVIFICSIILMGAAWAHKGQKCGFANILSGEKAFNKLSPQDSQYSYRSPDGHFTVYYDKTGIHAVDGTDHNGNLIPDLVETTAYHADKAWRLMIDSIGFHPPYLYDGTYVTNYPITIKRLGNLYGQTMFNTRMDIPSVPGNNYESYIELNNSYSFADHLSEDPFVRDSMGLAVTISHEFFHAVQLGYNIRITGSGIENDLWWIEASAVYFEEACTPQINDYFEYLESYYQTAYQPVYYATGRIYGEVILPLILTQKYSVKALLHIWEDIERYNAVESIGRYLKDHSSNWSKLLTIAGNWISKSGITGHENPDYIDQPLWPEYVNYETVDLLIGEQNLPSAEFEYSVSLYKCYDVPTENFWFYPITNANQYYGVALGDEGESVVTQKKPVEFMNVDAAQFLKLSCGWQEVQVIENVIFSIDTVHQTALERVSVFPNPCILHKHNRVKFLTENTIKHIRLFSVTGECVLSINPSSEQRYVTFSTDQLKSRLSGGVYIYLIQTDATHKGKLYILP